MPRHIRLVACIDQPAKPVGSADARVRGKIMERPIAPIEIQLPARHRHELKTVYTEALKIDQPLDDTVQRAVKLVDLEFIDDQIVQFGSFIGGVVPRKW